MREGGRGGAGGGNESRMNEKRKTIDREQGAKCRDGRESGRMGETQREID